MTDGRLRGLERRFQESGAPEDELAYLRECVRQGDSLDWNSYARLAALSVATASDYLLSRVERGDLGEQSLKLAAVCGHEAAGVAAGIELDLDLRRALEQLVDFDRRLYLMTILEVAQVAVMKMRAPALKGAATAAIEAVRSWSGASSAWEFVPEMEAISGLDSKIERAVATVAFWPACVVDEDEEIETVRYLYWCDLAGVLDQVSVALAIVAWPALLGGGPCSSS